jgi:hypothetical protein
VQYGRKLDHWHGETRRQSSPQVQDRILSPPVATKARSGSHSKEAAIKKDTNCKIDKQGVITDANGSTSVKVAMGLNQTSLGPIKGYKLAQGLISLFSKTRTGRRNPKLTHLITTPPNRSAAPHRPYMEVLRSGMDGGGKYGSGTGNRMRGSGASGFRGQGQGDAYARVGY